MTINRYLLIPKLLVARIRGAQEKVRQKRLSIVGAEYNTAQAQSRVDEFDADPVGFAERHYGRNGIDSYAVQTNLATNRDRISYQARRID